MTGQTDLMLGNRYRLTERIAGGGMGEVWRAEDTVLGRPVAVKILRREYADDATFLARFKAEARHSAGLSHQGIAAVYDFGEGDPSAGADTGSPYLVMELVPGEPLSTLVSRDGRLSPDRTLDVVGQAAFGLQAAHDAGVVHRDIKPGNILVTPDGTVKITDFGISRAANSAPLTRTGSIMGTAYYISPEQASGRSVTPASDVYSLGIVAYECLTGRRPFDGDTPVSVALAQVNQEPPALPDDLPAPVRDLVMQMLAKDPAGRPASAGDLGRAAMALRPAAATAATAATPAAQAPEPTRTLPVLDADGPGAHPAYADETTVVAPRLGTDTDPGFRLPDASRVPRGLPYAIALAVAAVVLLVALKACGSDPTRTTGAPGAETTGTGPTAVTSVDVVARDYLGRPVAEVRDELVGLGLRVDARRSAGGGVVGTVKDVTPTGTVEAGTTITLDVVAAAPEREHTKPGKGKGHGRGKGD
jgi:eukaryotic-like serine/threonine-protein kinase